MLFDTRYFWAVFTSRDQETTEGLRAIFERSKTASTSSIAIYEVFRLTLASEGLAVTRVRTEMMRREFKVIDVDSKIAGNGAEISHRLRVPMADALIMATAKKLGLPCVTDDPHFRDVKTVWV